MDIKPVTNIDMNVGKEISFDKAFKFKDIKSSQVMNEVSYITNRQLWSIVTERVLFNTVLLIRSQLQENNEI